VRTAHFASGPNQVESGSVAVGGIVFYLVQVKGCFQPLTDGLAAGMGAYWVSRSSPGQPRFGHDDQVRAFVDLQVRSSRA
jgi:hypothetical protein